MEFVIVVLLVALARGWIWRLEDGARPGRLLPFVGCGLLYAGLYGCALGWVVARTEVLGLFATFFSCVLVFGGVRRLAGHFGFNPAYYVASWGALSAMGLFLALIALIAVGPRVWTVGLPLFFVGAFVLLTTLARDWDRSAPNHRADHEDLRGEGADWTRGP